jgi:aminoglycoside phosphotransferase (APT) family kinase protein
MARGVTGDQAADDGDAVSGVAEPSWAREALARINAATGHSYRLGEHLQPNPTRPESGVWVLSDGDHRVCLKWLPGGTDLARQRAAAMTCERLHAAGSPVPRYHFVDTIAGDGFALMDFMPGHPVPFPMGTLTPGQARHLLELIDLQTGAGVLPAGSPDHFTNPTAGGILDRLLEKVAGPQSPQAAELLDRIAAMAEELRGVRVPSGDIVNRDMNPSNVLVDRYGGERIIGIVDWEVTTTGDRAADVAAILFWLWDKPGGEDTREVLWDGLVALCTEETFRLRVLALASWSLGNGKVDRASTLLTRMPA